MAQTTDQLRQGAAQERLGVIPVMRAVLGTSEALRRFAAILQVFPGYSQMDCAATYPRRLEATHLLLAQAWQALVSRQQSASPRKQKEV